VPSNRTELNALKNLISQADLDALNDHTVAGESDTCLP